MSQNKITVEITETYLLILAVYGNMGDGEIPKFMQSWAQGECRKNGLVEKFNQLQIAHVQELENRMRNTLGDEAVAQIKGVIAIAVDKLKR